MSHPAIDSLAALQQAEAEIGALRAKHREELKPLYEKRDRLAAEHADATGSYAVPRVSKRTDTQRKLERCPRCREQLVSE
jgi:hypothetical protein